MFHAEYIPHLNDDFKEVLGLVILNPSWLMTVMKIVMVLDSENDVKGLKKFNNLVCNGIADFEIFKDCWEKFETSNGVTVRHLCLIFQAFSLIYPVKLGCTSEYIIPYKLPADLLDRRPMKCNYSTTFYIEFKNFPPNEIYYLLISRCARKCTHKPTDQGLHNFYSKKRCFLYGLLGANWLIELEQEKQRLKIMVQ